MNDPTQTRGYRCNNPTNIIYNSKTSWRGELPHDPVIEPKFCRFKSPEFGYRAAQKILLSYHKRGLDTIRTIINTFAPPVENDTEAYIKDVAQRVGMDPDDDIDVDDVDYALPLLKSITIHELGGMPYEDSVVLNGIAMAV